MAFEQRQFSSALTNLQGADFKDTRINVVGKIMLIKIYYELEEFELLMSHLDSFQQFIRRKDVSDLHRINILNIIKYVKRIYSLPAFAKGEQR